MMNGSLRVWVSVATLIAAGLLAGCGDGSSPGSGAAAGSSRVDAELAALFEQVESGVLLLSASGAVTASTETTLGADARDSAIFRPSLGGGNARQGYNAEGPYSLTVYTDAFHEASPQNPVSAELTLILPEGARAGRHYTVNTFAGAEDDEVQAHFRERGMAWSFDRLLKGGVQVFELGDTISAAWRLDAVQGFGDNERRTSVEGAVSDLTLTPQGEADFEISLNGETEHIRMRVGGQERRGEYTLIIGRGIYIYFPTDVSPGTYPLQLSRNDGGLYTQFTQHDVARLDGELVLTVNEGRYNATFTIHGSGDDDVRVTGELSQIPLGG